MSWKLQGAVSITEYQMRVMGVVYLCVCEFMPATMVTVFRSLKVGRTPQLITGYGSGRSPDTQRWAVRVQCV